MIKPIINGSKVVFGPCRLSYCHLFAKYNFDGPQDEGKYMTNVLIPKTEKETLKAIKEAIEKAKEAAISAKWRGKDPTKDKKFEWPLRDGEDKDDEAYEGHMWINAKAKTRPGICDRQRVTITDEEEIYSGVWAVVSVTFYGYDSNGSKGIACGLNNVMKWKDDESFGGRVSAEADFADIEDEEDDL